MATFSLLINNDQLYTSVMEELIKRSLTHSKDHRGGTVEIEVIGSNDDYQAFKKLIEDSNLSKGFFTGEIKESI